MPPTESDALVREPRRGRVGGALRRRSNWEQLLKFCVVGVTGYAVNLAVYLTLLRGFDLNYLLAAMLSFAVAVTNNYLLNRLWTFRKHRGAVVRQGLRFLAGLAARSRREPHGAQGTRRARCRERSSRRRLRSSSSPP